LGILANFSCYATINNCQTQFPVAERPHRVWIWPAHFQKNFQVCIWISEGYFRFHVTPLSISCIVSVWPAGTRLR